MCLGWCLSEQPRAAEAGEGCGGAAGLALAVSSCTVVGSAGPHHPVLSRHNTTTLAVVTFVLIYTPPLCAFLASPSSCMLFVLPPCALAHILNFTPCNLVDVKNKSCDM
jgi:hypothetical protein